ncbi:hypothetical protein PM082_000479 [Marasmius tenuissimus]|nr:hypothetical protein PM082_000479 [Marasmius tenuissimus]
MFSSLLFALLPLAIARQVVAYDYVIIGGGTAGLTVASRLAEDDDVSILVLEAGPNAENFPEVYIPGLVFTGRFSALNWLYGTTSQPGFNNRTSTVGGGKALGGSTVVNAMIFPRGLKEQYDTWAALNHDSSWTWSSLLPFFKRSENFMPPNEFQVANGARYDPEVHGLNPKLGRVKVGFQNYFFPQARIWEETAVGLGIAASPDLSNGDPQAVGISPNSIDPVNNTRCSATCAYYTPFTNRTNFEVITNAVVSRIIWSYDGDTNSSGLVASGVEYYLVNTTTPVFANVTREVIVSAGAVGSPKVLELSGVGNSTILKAAGIKPVLHRPTVGENFADHVHSWATFVNTPNDTLITTDILQQNPPFAQEQLNLWNENRTGMYSAAYGRTLGIIPPLKVFEKSALDALVKDARANITAYATRYANGNKGLVKGIEAQHEIALKLFEEDRNGPLEMNLNPGYNGPTPATSRPKGNYTAITVVLYAPLSRGRVHISSSNYRAPPSVNPAYYSHPIDVAAHVGGIKLARKMMRSPPLSSMFEREVEPGLARETDADIEDWLRDVSEGDNHPTGTMSMLPRKLGGVVDTSLKLYGTANVRIADASIIPFPISAHTSSTVYMVGEKAAQIIKDSYRST